MSIATGVTQPNEDAADLMGNGTESEFDWNNTATWTFSDSPSSSPSTTPSALPSMAPSLAPTTNLDKFVNSNDSKFIAETFRLYGSLYLLFFVSFCLLRKKLPRFFNIRSWVPEFKTDLAIETEYGYVSWVWKVFNFSDDDLLETCGMDALCFLRSLRLGSKLTTMGTMNSIWLVPLYLTAEDAVETQQLTNPYVLMSIANVPNKSPRFIGTVVAVYITILVSMYLISKEYEWYIEYRHKYLAQRKPRNYAIYVSGIPDDIRSSYALADYFRQSTSWSDTVYEAHIAMDIPSLEAKVAKRDKLVEKLEHIMELERRKGRTKTHHTMKIHKGEGVKRVESVSTYMKKLEILNSKITLEAGRITRSNHRMRQHLTRSSTLRNISEEDLLHQDTAVEGSDETRQRPKLGIGVSAPTLATQVTSFSSMRGFEDRDGSFSRIDYCGDIEEGSVPSTQTSAANLDVDGQIATNSDASKNASVTEPSTDDSRAFFFRPQSPEVHEPHPFLAMFGLNPTLFTQPGRDLRDAEETLNSLSVDTPEKVYADNLEDSFQLANSEKEASIELIRDDSPPSNLENFDVVSESSQVDDSSSGGGEVDGESTAPDMIGERSSSETNKKWIWTSSNRKSTWLLGSTIRSNAASMRDGMTRGAQNIGSGTALVGSKVKLAGKVGASTVKAAGSMGVTGIKKAADFGIQKIYEAPDYAVDLGANITAQLAASASAVVPLRLGRSEGQAKEAGFVIFRDLYSTQAARQMLQHHNATSLWVEAAPDPDEVFWRNVGLPEKARRSGRILSTFATSFLCLFWSIPVAFFSSLTSVNSLKDKLPLLAQWVEDYPFLESFLALIAPLLLLSLNNAVLPFALKWFGTWEGHVGASLLEASLFVKLCAFVFIQTFFVSALSGTITSELANILNDPEQIVTLLANSLPAQSSYFIQICLVFTFLLHGLDLVRAYPLTMAFFRRFVFGPRLTEKERRRTWSVFNSLEDPPEFWHAEISAQVMIFFVVFFVYCTIAPITCPFLLICFLIMESGYRYHFVHNQKPFPDSGGKLWVGFVHVLMASMLIGQITLFGQLILQKTVYALPALAPLGVITILFMIFIVPKRNHVANYLPTIKCVEIDKKFKESGDSVKNFAAKEYLQPALKAGPMYPEGAEIPRLRIRTMSRDGTR